MKMIGERRGGNKRRGGKRKKNRLSSTSWFRLTAVGDCWKATKATDDAVVGLL